MLKCWKHLKTGRDFKSFQISYYDYDHYDPCLLEYDWVMTRIRDCDIHAFVIPEMGSDGSGLFCIVHWPSHGSRYGPARSMPFSRLATSGSDLAISRNISHMLSCLQRDLRDLGWYWMVSERILGKDKDIQRRCLCKIQKPDEKDGKFLQMTWTSSKTQKSPSWQGKLMYALQIDANDGRRARNASLWDQSRSRQIKTDQIIHGNMLSYCNIM